MRVTEIAIDANGDAVVTVGEGDMATALDRAPWALREWAATVCNRDLKVGDYIRPRAAMVAALEAVELW